MIHVLLLYKWCTCVYYYFIELLWSFTLLNNVYMKINKYMNIKVRQLCRPFRLLPLPWGGTFSLSQFQSYCACHYFGQSWKIEDFFTDVLDIIQLNFRSMLSILGVLLGTVVGFVLSISVFRWSTCSFQMTHICYFACVYPVSVCLLVCSDICMSICMSVHLSVEY